MNNFVSSLIFTCVRTIFLFSYMSLNNETYSHIHKYYNNIYATDDSYIFIKYIEVVSSNKICYSEVIL